MFVPEAGTFRSLVMSLPQKLCELHSCPGQKSDPPVTGISDHYANDHSQCDRQHWIHLQIFQASVLYGIFVFHIERKGPCV